MANENKSCCCSSGVGSDCNDACGQCGSGCGGSRGCSGCGTRVIYVTEDEKEFLMKLAQLAFLPLVRFVIENTQSGDITEGMAPVYLEDAAATPETVQKTGQILTALSEKYLITLDYDLPLQNGDYTMFENAEVYREFYDTTTTGASSGYDRPALQRGSMALTSLGQEALDSME